MFASALGVTLLAWMALIFIARRISAAVRHTSLVTASRWLIGAGLAVCPMATTDLALRLWPERTADYGWLVTAILLLCPLIAVLGSRRPGVRVWSVFILLPMVVVLSWPVWTMLLQGSEPRGLELELPTVIGFGFVLLMGAGNYLGTQFAWSCVLYMAGTALLFTTCTGWSIMADSTIVASRLIAIGFLVFAVFVAARLRFRKPKTHRTNVLWQDFKNLFGNVWALRMVERINSFAIQEGWTARITYDGFPETSEGRLASNEHEIETACRWLFRRFVDDEWIEHYLSDAS